MTDSINSTSKNFFTTYYDYDFLLDKERNWLEYVLEESQQQQFRKVVELQREKETKASSELFKLTTGSLYLLQSGPEDKFKFIIPKEESEIDEEVFLVGNVFNHHGINFLENIDVDKLSVIGGNTYAQKLIYNVLVLAFIVNVFYFFSVFFFKSFDYSAVLSRPVEEYYRRFKEMKEKEQKPIN